MAERERTGSAADRLSAAKRALLEKRLRQGGARLRQATASIPRRASAAPAPLSFAQERLWLVDRLEPGAPAYDLPGRLDFDGHLDVGALRRAWAALIERHEALRTVFPSGVDGEPVQRVEPPARVGLPVADLRSLPAARRRVEIGRRQAILARHRFDLARGPLLRAVLVLRQEDRHALLLNVHHVVADGVSLEVLLRDLAALYRAQVTGRQASLPELAVQYADFAAWQREWMSGERLETQLAAHRRRLEGASFTLDLPTDRPRTAGRARRGAVVRAHWPRRLLEDLARAGRDGATPFMALLTLYGALLSRHAAQEDLIVASPVANRRRPELEPLIGFFVNTLLLRIDLSGRPSFRQALARVRDDSLDALSHQDLPYERLAQVLSPDGRRSPEPLFRTTLTFLERALPELRLPGAVARPRPVDNGTAKFDLAVTLEVTGESLGATWELDAGLFDTTRVRRLADQYGRLLAAAAAAPDRPLDELPLESPAERHQVLREWNDTAVAPSAPWGGTVPEVFLRQVERSPEATALLFEGGAWSYRQLARRAAAVARELRRAGVGPDLRVAVAAQRSPETVAALVGISLAGGAYVALDPQHPDSRLLDVLEDALGESEPRLLLVRRGGEGRWRRLAEQAAVAFRPTVLPIDPGEPTEAAAARPPRTLSEDHLAYVAYTSGSTGRPKGVAVPHGAVLRLVDPRSAGAYADFGPDRTGLLLAPISFDASTFEIWGPLLHGGRLAIAPAGRLSLQELGWTLRRWKVDTLWLTAGLFHRMVEDAVESLGALRQLLAGGDVLSPSHVRQALGAAPGLVLINGYGPTENTTFTCCHRMHGAGEVPSPVPVGRPIAGTRVHLLDRHLRPVPVGVAGELYAAGCGLARGYHRRPGQTAAAFVPAPAPDTAGERLYRTGDVARFRPDGSLDFLGRIDRQVKIRGFRVEPAEAEVALRSHPQVRDAVVVVVRRDGGGPPTLAAYVVPEAGVAEPAAWRAELERHVAERLPEPFRPTSLTILEALPLTVNGKVDRAGLPVPAPLPAAAAGERGGPPQTTTEELLAQIWRDVLGVEVVRREDDFFDLGGHSLLATRVVSRVGSTFGVELGLERTFEAPTLQELARAIDALAADGRRLPPLLPATGHPPGARHPLSYAQERLWLVDRLRPGDPSYNIPAALDCDGPLSWATLAQALGEVARRQAVLRTVYRATDQGPRQIVEPAGRRVPPVVDLTRLQAAERCRQADALATAHGLRPFDLERGPVWRAVLARVGPERHRLLVCVHHIGADGASMELLLRELTELHENWAEGRPSPRPDLPVQVTDFARWQRSWLTGALLERELEHWRRRLGDAVAVPGELPADRPRPPRPSGRGGRVRLHLSAARAAALRRRARDGGNTLFMVLLAVFDVFLARHLGRRQIVVGSPVAARTRPETQELIGFFVDLLPLCVDLSGDPSVGALLGRVRETALAAYGHPDLPLERLVESLGTDSDPSRHPLFQAAFALQHPPEPESRSAGLHVRITDVPHPTAKLDLTWAATEEPKGGLTTEIEYSTDLFDAVTVERFRDRLDVLLAAVTEAPEDLPWTALPAWTDAELRQLLGEWCRGESPSPGDLPAVPGQIRARARKAPDTLAIEAGERKITYAALVERAEALAARLEALDIGPEAVVALHLPRGPERVIAILAVSFAGAAHLPLDPTYPRQRLRLLVEDSRARLVIMGPESAGLFADLPVTLLELDESVFRGAAVPLRHPDAESLAYVVYTSGSTGRPKGVAVGHRSLAGLVAWHRRTFATGSGDRVSHLAGLGFDASVWEVWPCLAAGATLVLPPEEALRSRPEELRDWLLSAGVTQAFLPTPVAESLLELSWPRRGSLALLLTGGDRLHRFAPAHGRFRLVNNYGPTESTVVATSGPVAPAAGDGGAAFALPDIGRPVAPVRVYLLDPRDGRPVPPGVPGEIVIGGIGLARGYLHRPAWTAEWFVPDPHGDRPGGRLYRTGDLARHRPDGRIDFLGRRDDQVQVRGVRVEPAEVEAALEALPGIGSAVVVARNLGAGPALVAYLVVDGRGGRVPATDLLRAALRERLPEPWIPAAFVTLETLPLTPHGKVDRGALPTPAAGETAEPPRTPEEARICAVWSEVLGTAVGRTDDFFALGGHSLDAARATSRLREELSVDLAMDELFSHPTPAALARRMERMNPAARLEPDVSRRREAYEAPLSFGQERLWFLDRLDPDTTSLHIPVGTRLEGRLAAQALSGALSEAVRRHHVLRSRFRQTEDGSPVAVVESPRRWSPPRVDLSALAPPDRTRTAEALLEAVADRPFDLTRGPLWRWVLVRETATSHRLLSCVHHVVADGWSLGVLLDEVAEHYGELAVGRPCARAAPIVQYADFAAWQRRRLAEGDLDPQLEYWRTRLSNPLEPLDLPIDRPRPAVQTYRGGSYLSRIPRPVLETLTAVGRREGATRFMVLLATFQLLLARLSGRTEVQVGAPAAGRGRPEIDRLVGFFLHTLVLRLEVGDDPTFRQLVRRVREETTAAFTHQEAPFEKILEAVQAERDASRTPLFQVFFNMLDLPQPHLRLPGLRWTSEAPREAPAKFDLTVYLRPDGEDLLLDWVYNADLFDAERVEEMAAQLGGLLASLAEQPDLPVSRHRLETERGRRYLPDPGRELPTGSPGPLHSLFERQALASPDRAAVVAGETLLTYGQLAADVASLAAALAERGVGRGDVVAIYAARAPALVTALLAVSKSGAAFLVLDPEHPPGHVAQCFELAAAVGLLRLAAAGPLPDALRDAIAAAGAFELEPPTARPALPRGGRAPAVPVGPEDAAYVAFTSGTTGTPKGIVGRHGSLTHFTPWAVGTFELTSGDRYSVLSGLSHDPLHRDLFLPLQTGGTIVVPAPGERRLSRPLAAWLEREQVTVAHLTPALGRLLTDAGSDVGLPALRRSFFIGEALREHDVARLRAIAPGCGCWNAYGTTETQRALSYHSYHGADPGALPARGEVLPLGRGYEAVQLLVLNRSGEPAGIGEPGELYLRSPFLARGYLNDPARTAARFLPSPAARHGGDRMYRTGDLGRYRLDGEVEFLGRLDHQVQIRGFRIEPAEIEAHLERCPGVRQAVVVTAGAEAESGPEQRLVAYVVGSDLAVEELRRRLRHELPPYMVPAAFVTLEALPLTANGKLDRRALPAPAWEGEAAGEAPRSALEQRLALMWGELLGLEHVSRDADFFASGGHSLLAARLVSRLLDAEGVELPLRALFEAPTPAALATVIEAAPGAAPEATPLAARIWPADAPRPLSFAQKRLWFLDRFQPGNAAYHIPVAFDLAGAVGGCNLAAAVREIARRHEILRSRFTAVGGEPVQRVEATAPPLSWVDLSGLAEADRRLHTARLLRIEAARPFDLATQAPVRWRLLRTSSEHHVLFGLLHHIAADGWSLGVVSRELASLYPRYRAGGPSPLPEPSLQYADFAIWQAERVEREPQWAEHLAWWRRHLADAPGALELPTDRPRPARQSFRGTSRPVQISAPLATALTMVCRAAGATPFMGLLAAFSVLLAHGSRQPTLVVGTPVAGRTRRALEDLVGLFVNTLPLRIDLAGADTWGSLLERVRDTTLEATARQEVPFERLVEALRPRRDPSRPPVFQTMLAFHNVPEGARRIAGLEMTRRDLETAGSKLDLALAFVPENDGSLAGRLEYDTELFDATTIERFVRRLGRVIAAVTAEPERPLSQLPFLAEAERTQLLWEWNDTERRLDEALLLPHAFDAAAGRHPDRVALRWRGEQMSWGELDRRSAALARVLAGRGTKPDDRVALLLERGLELVVGLWGILRAGAAYVPVDPSYPASRVRYVLVDARVVAAVTDAAHAADLPLELPWIDPAAPSGPQSEPPPPPAEAAAYVIYTSGSTGRPKGVVVGHGNAAHFLTAMDGLLGQPAGAWLAGTSMSFDISVLELLWTLTRGVPVVLGQEGPATGTSLAEAVEHHGVRSYQCTPSRARMHLLEPADRAAAGRLDRWLVGGEALPPDLAGELLATGVGELINVYGPTETTVWSSSERVSGSPVAIGRPLANTEMYVLDAAGRPVPTGTPGELAIGGAGVTRGYWRRPAATAARFVPDDFGRCPGGRIYRTGDLVRSRADGRLEFLGRIDLQVKIRGYRIELGEVEAWIGRHPAVRSAVAAARIGPGGDVRLVAYVVGRRGPVNPVALRELLGRHLPAPMVPSVFVPLDELPMTPNGKVDRNTLPEPAWGGESAGDPPRSPLERRLAELWTELLEVEGVSRDSDFFALGGHSLLVARLTSRLRDAEGVEVPIAEVFDAPTPARLAARIEVLRGAGEEAGMPTIRDFRSERTGPVPASLEQERFWRARRQETRGVAANIPWTLRLAPSVVEPALLRSLRETVERHEILRSTLAAAGRRLAQEIALDDRSAGARRVDLSALVPVDRHEELRRLAVVTGRRRFDLARGPLLRQILVTGAAGERVLLVTLHHVLVDGWSIALLGDELEGLYASLVRGEPATAPPEIQYQDFARWQRHPGQDERRRRQRLYWREQLRGVDPRLRFGVSGSPPARTHRAGQESLRLSPETTNALREASAGESATPFMWLLAVYKTLLHLETGQDDLAVLTLFARRPTRETERMIGNFFTGLPLRSRFAGVGTFRELLRQVRRTVVDAQANADVLYDQVLEEDLHLDAHPGDLPFFRSLFVLQSFPLSSGERASVPLEVERLPIHTGRIRHDLHLFFVPEPDGGLSGRIRYDTGVLDAASAARLRHGFLELLDRVLRDPDVDFASLTSASRAAWRDAG